MAEPMEQVLQEAEQGMNNLVKGVAKEVLRGLDTHKAYSREELVAANAALRDLPEDKFQSVMQATEERMGTTDVPVEEFAEEMEKTRRIIEEAERAAAEARASMSGVANAAVNTAGAAAAAAAIVAEEAAEMAEEESKRDIEAAAMEAENNLEREAEINLIANEEVSKEMEMRQAGQRFFTQRAVDMKNEMDILTSANITSMDARNEFDRVYSDLMSSIDELQDMSVDRMETVNGILKKEETLKNILDPERDKASSVREQGQSILTGIDTSQLNEATQVMHKDFKEFDETMQIAKEDIGGLEENVLDLEQQAEGFERLQRDLEKMSRDDKATKAAYEAIKNPLDCIGLDFRRSINDLKASLNIAKAAEKNYEHAKTSYISIVAGMAKDKLNDGISSVAYMAHKAVEKAGNICKAAISKVHEMMDKCKEALSDTMKKAFFEGAKILDKATGGSYSRIALKEVEKAEKAAPSNGFVDMMFKRDADEALCMIDCAVMDRYLTGRRQVEYIKGEGIVNHTHEHGWIDYAAQKEFWQNVKEANWGKDNLTPVEKFSNKMTEVGEKISGAIDKSVDFILDIPEHVKNGLHQLAVNIHNLGVDIHAGAVELGAKAMDGMAKFESWKERTSEHIKAGLIREDKKIENIRFDMYDKVDNFLGMEKKKTSEYQPSEKLTRQLEALEGISKPTPLTDYAKEVVNNKIRAGEAAHYALGNVGHSIEFTAKKIAGFAPALAAQITNDALGAQVKRNLEKIDRLDKKIEATRNVRDGFSSKAEVLLGKAAEIRANNLKGADAAGKDVKDLNDDQDKGDERE